MDQHVESANGQPRISEPDDGVFCTSLFLSGEIVCDRGGIVHTPTRSHLWEYCMTARSRRCPIASTAAGLGQGPDPARPHRIP